MERIPFRPDRNRRNAVVAVTAAVIVAVVVPIIRIQLPRATVLIIGIPTGGHRYCSGPLVAVVNAVIVVVDVHCAGLRLGSACIGAAGSAYIRCQGIIRMLGAIVPVVVPCSWCTHDVS